MQFTKEQLLENLRDNQVKLIGFINFTHQSGHVVDIESICINGNAVQLEVKPFESENRFNELSKSDQDKVNVFINSVASGGRDISEITTY